MKIGVTDNQKPNFNLYVQWLRRADPSAKIVKLSHLTDNLHELDHCDGLVLTGGGDVDPARYQRGDAVGQVRGVDARRDEFEFSVIDKSEDREIPILGICRGLQVTNVKFGGSLIVDLVSKGFVNHRQEGDEELRHPIHVVPGSLLSAIIGANSGDVNSAHHQAADLVGDGLKVSARSPDGVIEGLEWANPVGRSFLILVQWHPERMRDVDNQCSKNILNRFLSEVRKFVEA